MSAVVTPQLLRTVKQLEDGAEADVCKLLDDLGRLISGDQRDDVAFLMRMAWHAGWRAGFQEGIK